MNWILEDVGFSAEEIPNRGNRFLIGNGYLGVRGTLDEDRKGQLAAVNLAGIYDQAGDGWREPLNAPNPFYTICLADGKELSCGEMPPQAHRQSLDFRHGLAKRSTRWSQGNGSVLIESQRFVSMERRHLMGCRYTVTAAEEACRVEVRAGIDGDVWDINGPHYAAMDIQADGNVLSCQANTASGACVAAARKVFPSSGMTFAFQKQDRRGWLTAEIDLEAGESITFDSLIAIYTSNDTDDPVRGAKESLAEFERDSYDVLKRESFDAWEKIWEGAQIELEGDAEAEKAIHYSLYHLNSIAPPPELPVSIPARGLSGQTYKGAVFWDTEMFMLDYFLYTRPEIARALLKYRVDTLPGAQKKAADYGWQGAFYAWESQEGGWDACSDYNVTDVFTGRPMRTYFKDKQVHISAAIARAIMRYTHISGDASLLAEGGARVVIECARFYHSLLVRPNATGRLELHDVIGPDEYHERVHNNAYTNRMAAASFDWAVEASELLQRADPSEWRKLQKQLDLDTLLQEFQQARRELYQPQPNETGVIPQFDGYFSLEDTTPEALRARFLDPREYWGGAYGVAAETQVLKQADVVAMLSLFAKEFPVEILRRNWEYYEPRTEHGSSLSACMYGLLACYFGQADLAYPFFMESAGAELRGGGKQWAGLVYIGGTHPAAAGGAWMVLIQGFAGLHFSEKGPDLKPCLPKGWKRLAFRFVFQGKAYRGEITQDQAVITPLQEEL